MLTKEQTDPYEISARKIGKPKDEEQWQKEKEETYKRMKQSQPNPPKEKAESKEPTRSDAAS